MFFIRVIVSKLCQLLMWLLFDALTRCRIVDVFIRTEFYSLPIKLEFPCLVLLLFHLLLFFLIVEELKCGFLVLLGLLIFLLWGEIVIFICFLFILCNFILPFKYLFLFRIRFAVIRALWQLWRLRLIHIVIIKARNGCILRTIARLCI